jgi:hypothetical protein
LTSKERELPEKFSDHLSYSNKLSPRERRRGKLGSVGFYGPSWEELAFPPLQRELKILAFVLHCGPPWL